LTLFSLSLSLIFLLYKRINSRLSLISLSLSLSLSTCTYTAISGRVHRAGCNGALKQDDEAFSAFDFSITGEDFFLIFFPFFFNVSVWRRFCFFLKKTFSEFDFCFIRVSLLIIFTLRVLIVCVRTNISAESPVSKNLRTELHFLTSFGTEFEIYEYAGVLCSIYSQRGEVWCTVA